MTTTTRSTRFDARATSDPAWDAELFLERRDGVRVVTEAAAPLHSCDRR